MPRATWKGTLLAEAPADKVQIVEGNVYFPPEDVQRDHLSKSDTPYTCPWKGECTYYDVVVNGETEKDAAWTYLDPKPEAKHIQGHVAFWRGVNVER